MRARKRELVQGEQGQSLVMVIVCMFAVIVIAALAIDVSSWYQKHHQAQVSADAAALAAANCLLKSNSTSTAANNCATATDTTHASNVATTIAQTNAVPITGSVAYGTSPAGVITNVTVTTATSAPSFFANVGGILSANISARSVAKLTWTFQNCTTIGDQAGGGCLMFYAASNSCAAGQGTAAIYMHIGQSDVLNGGIFSNGSIDDSKGNGGTINAPVTYGAGSQCSLSPPGNGNTSFKGNADTKGATQQTTNRGSPSNPNWPIDYSTYFPACSGTSCGGPGGTPSYCTYAQSSFSAYQGSGVYCAYGTGTKSDPSTWNGTIAFPSNQGSTATPLSVTLIAGNISLSSNSVYKAYSNNLFAYAACSSSTCSNSQAPYFSAVGGGLTYTGDVFVPNGQASYTGGNVNFTGMTEAQTIVDLGGDQTGDGPAFDGGAQLVPGNSSLTQ